MICRCGANTRVQLRKQQNRSRTKRANQRINFLIQTHFLLFLFPTLFLCVSAILDVFLFSSSFHFPLIFYIIFTSLLCLVSPFPFLRTLSPLPLSLVLILLSSPLLSSPPLPWVLCWEHNSRICFAASHQISVDFSAAKLQFSRVDELL